MISNNGVVLSETLKPYSTGTTELTNSLAFSRDNMFLSCSVYIGSSPFKSESYVKFSSDMGATWGGTVTVNSTISKALIMPNLIILGGQSFFTVSTKYDGYQIMYSTNGGSSYTGYNLGGSGRVSGIVYTGTNYIAISSVVSGHENNVTTSGLRVLKSSNGTSWSTTDFASYDYPSYSNAPSYASVNGDSLVYNNGKLVYCSQISSTQPFMYSSDEGVSWTKCSALARNVSVYSMTAIGNTIVANGYDGSRYVILKSTDGINWGIYEKIQSYKTDGSQGFTDIAPYTCRGLLIASDGAFGAYSNGANVLEYSYDGITWFLATKFPAGLLGFMPTINCMFPSYSKLFFSRFGSTTINGWYTIG